MVAPSILVEIGRVLFSIRSTQVVLPPEPRRTYRPFCQASAEESSELVRVPVLLKMGQIPDLKDMTRIFDTDQSWAMFLDRDEYVLIQNPERSSGRALWVARFKRDVPEVVVTCGEKFIRKRGGKQSIINPISYPLDQLLLMHVLATREGAVLHAAGLNVGGRGFLFLGPSGAGKSTLSGLLTSRRGFEMVSDDRIVVRKVRNVFKGYGTPWPGDLGVAVNKSAPLSGIFFIHHGSRNRIKPIPTHEAVEKLLPVISVPWYDRTLVPHMLAFCEDLTRRVPAYDLYFKPTREIVKKLEEVIFP